MVVEKALLQTSYGLIEQSHGNGLGGRIFHPIKKEITKKIQEPNIPVNSE